MPQIVLIGPVRSGKSTIARKLSRRIGIRNVPLDLVRWGYYFRIGYDLVEEANRVQRDGPAARFVYWKPFEVYAAERVLADYPEAIIDFGAGHSVFTDPDQIARVRAALAPADHVILLLPDPDIETALRILIERDETPPEYLDDFMQEVRPMLESPCNAAFATATLYTHGKTPEETVDEVVAIISSGPR